MCGIISLVGDGIKKNTRLDNAINILHHRGPDAKGIWISPTRRCLLAHTRLSIIDLSVAGNQPMSDQTGSIQVILNGEIYNYIELKNELAKDHIFRTQTDTEVLIACYKKWGENFLDKLIGMFAFVLWDEKKQMLFAARDRFGVKPMYYAVLATNEIGIASEIKALHTLGVPREPDPIAWASYLRFGIYDYGSRTFWKGVKSLPAGHVLSWKNGIMKIKKWYDLYETIGDTVDTRDEEEVKEHYLSLLRNSISLRFRSDVPIGINISGGLDSSILLGLVHAVQGEDSSVDAFTFITGDENYDELPWVNTMLANTKHPHYSCLLRPEEVPKLAETIQWFQDEPFGGMPTLAYSKIFAKAKELGTIVLLDGQGIDEQWAGYDYYSKAFNEQDAMASSHCGNYLQGSTTEPVRPECLVPEFFVMAEEANFPKRFLNSLRNMQYIDIYFSKLPKSLRFNDRISMMHSTELREPFLDHRLFEIAMSQPDERKIRGGVHKALLRQMAKHMIPDNVREAPKRPVQTPQREWLREDLKDWTEACIKRALDLYGSIWLDKTKVLKEWEKFCKGKADNSFYIFQWISICLMMAK